MIKLNNKKITYVALADTNNSLKAPKEIWYADSSNSVKLVYRRKDALIEDEDYEKYHWLQGRNGAYINTERFVKTYEDAFEVYAKYDGTTVNPDGGEQNLFGIQGNIKLASYIDSNNNINAIIKQSDGSNYNINIHKEVFKIALYAPNSSEYIKALDDTSYTNQIIGTVTNDTNLKMYVFARNGKVNSYFHGDISYFHITDTTFTIDKLHLIPCKLLKPVPKWLDANGIRRQVGECGMIDLVSGKFYGNVNSVGTFTVENYYERKEWLVGDGTAYIDVPRSNEVTDVIHFKLDASNSGLEGIRGIFGNLNLGIGGKNTIHFVKYNSNLMSCRAFNSDNEVRPVRYNVMDVDILIDSVKVNSDTYELDRDLTALEGYSMPIFSRRRINADLTTNITDEIIKASLAYFKIDDVLNLIPCTLTMDLPASMDANNIARAKGTSGMWDLVSDKFYGNVANSGTFKAVNLAQGVDYEVHQWLKVSVSTKVDMAALPVDSPNLYFKHKHISGINYHYFRTTGDGVDYNYFYASDVYRCAIWNLSNSTRVYNNQDIIEDEIVINCNSSNRYFNGYNIPIYGSTIKQVSIISRDQSGFEGLTSSITVDGIERYIPVKLLRSLPSKYDANGIARQAGECGMYDTVNDVFYGNVANSGSFTVSDDN